ncbi:MAG: hypothetical protein RI963_2967 [Planctomycetota bacterium]|jgi:pantothenate kinase
MTKRVMGRITLLQHGHAMQTKADDVLTNVKLAASVEVSKSTLSKLVQLAKCRDKRSIKTDVFVEKRSPDG